MYVLTRRYPGSGHKPGRALRIPLTGTRVVNRVYTDPAVIDITDNGFEVIEVSPWICFDDVVARTSALLRNASLESIPQDELSPFATVAPAISKAL